MSTITNGRELIARAEGHAKFDRISQGTYGKPDSNGSDVEYKGCAMFCLSTPATIADENIGIWNRIWNMLDRTGEFEREDEIERIREEFGICDGLLDLTEAIFEGLPFHGGAIEFIPEVARKIAQCEGLEITDWEIQRWRSDHDYWPNGDPDMGPTSKLEEMAEEARDDLFEYLDERALELAPEPPEPTTVPRKEPEPAPTDPSIQRVWDRI
jgi:hypothetical protein